MFNKILTALDPVEPDNDVVYKAQSLSRTENSQLRLLSVLTVDVNSAFVVPEYSIVGQSYRLNDWNLFEERYKAYKSKNESMLRRLVEQGKATGIQTDFAQVMGSPGREICNAAKTWSADLIVVGSHQRKGLREMILGSVSNYVLHHAPCSVLVVHPSIQASNL